MFRRQEVLSDTDTKQEIQMSNIPRSFRFDETKQTTPQAKRRFNTYRV